MNLLSQIICLSILIMLLICHKKTYIYEQFIDTKNYYNDIFQTIFNQYNPYLQLYKTPQDLLKIKCYYQMITKDDISKFIVNNIKNNQINGNQMLYTSIYTIQKNYFDGFLIETFKLSKKTNILYHYYNKIINVNTFLSILTNYIITIKYDQLIWIVLCHKIIIDNNLLQIKSYNYDDVFIFCTFILDELKKYSNIIFNQTNEKIDVKTTLYLIKNKLFYGDDGNYFTINNIFDCKKYIM